MKTELRAMAAGNPRIKFLGPLQQKELGGTLLSRGGVHCSLSDLRNIRHDRAGSVCAKDRRHWDATWAHCRSSSSDSGGGFVYRTDEELLEAMDRLADSPALRDELGQKGYEAFCNHGAVKRTWSSISIFWSAAR